jgi:hypothetical protein
MGAMSRAAIKNLPVQSLMELRQIVSHDLWRRGELQYKLKPCQLDMLCAIEASRRFKYLIKCARRLGKTYLLCTIAIMTCLRKNGAQVRYAAPTKVSLRKLIRPIMRKILKDCPEHLKPKFSDNTYTFPNPELVGTGARDIYEGGSEIHLAGVNNGNSDDLRGTAADLFIVDEAGSVDDLHYLVHDVAMPQLLDEDLDVVEGRRLLIASSPPRTPAHEFTAMAREAEVDGNYSHYNIFAGGYPEEVLRLFLKEDGIPEEQIQAFLGGDYDNVSSTIKREYLALDVVDTESALVPEWTADFVVSDIVKDEFWPFYFKYESLDVGVKHFSVCLFGHYDFRQARLFIHDEVKMNGPQMTTKLLAAAITQTERVVFGIPGKEREDPPKIFEVRKRISDKDLLLIQDLRADHQLTFAATDKGELEQMINDVRIWVGAKKVFVHERCKQLRGCLAFGVWNKHRTDFDVSLEFGHFDALAALMYLIRNIKADAAVNPIPLDYGKPAETHWVNPEKKKSERNEKIRRAFAQRRGRRIR